MQIQVKSPQNLLFDWQDVAGQASAAKPAIRKYALNNWPASG
jgi:hypothetical protein